MLEGTEKIALEGRFEFGGGLNLVYEWSFNR
jgi:hypothetical protein